MRQDKAAPNIKKLVLFGTLALCVPIFLICMAFIAVSSDAENQQKYKQQQAEQTARLKLKQQQTTTENATTVSTLPASQARP